VCIKISKEANNRTRKDLKAMTITFSPGQFFHPIYGWFDKEPELNTGKNRSGMILEPIGEEHALKPGDPLYDLMNSSAIFDRFAMQFKNNPEQRAPSFDPDLAYIYEPKDLSYYLDGQNKGTGAYNFIYKDNTMTAKIDDNAFAGLNTAEDVIKRYEQHRQSILDLKKSGYNNEAINMLLKALDEEFVNARFFSLETQLADAGKTYGEIREATKQFFQEYLRLRGGGGTTSGLITIAGNNLKNKGVLPQKVDPSYSSSSTNGMRFLSKAHEQDYLAFLARTDAIGKAYTDELERQENAKNNLLKNAVAQMKANGSWEAKYWDASETHIRNIDRIVDFSNNATMSDVEKEARSLSVVFRVRGDQMIDYARRYEEMSGELDIKLKNGDITQEHYDRYRADLNTAFIKTYNLDIMGQATAAGLSDEKAKELAIAFSEEYIKIHEQTAPGERNADKIANAALKKLAAQGWPEFSLYTSENRAKVDKNDPWYAMMDEDALYWHKLPQPYENW